MTRRWMVLVAVLCSEAALAQGKLGSFANGFNKGYSDSVQMRALEQQDEMVEEQLKMQRLELRRRSGLRNLQALETADRRSSERLADVLLQLEIAR